MNVNNTVEDAGKPVGSVDDIAKKNTLRGQPFIGKYVVLKDKKGSHERSRKCLSCYFRELEYPSGKPEDCYIKDGSAKKLFGIDPNKYMPRTLDGKEVGYYCPFWACFDVE